jgi:adenylate kinase
LLHISTGDLFRYEMSHNTELGLLAKSYIAKGELVPDAVTIGMLRKRVEANPDVKGYIFDGFPRTVPQAEALDKLLVEKHQTISALVELTVDEDEIVKRILLRGKNSGRSDDNDESIVRKRIQVYRKETTPVADYYGQFGKSLTVEGIGSIEGIFKKLCKTIDNHVGRKA